MMAATILPATVTTNHPSGAVTKSVRDRRYPGHVVAHLITATTAEAVQNAITDLENRYPEIHVRGPYRCDVGWLAACRTFGLTGTM